MLRCWKKAGHTIGMRRWLKRVLETLWEKQWSASFEALNPRPTLIATPPQHPKRAGRLGYSPPLELGRWLARKTRLPIAPESSLQIISQGQQGPTDRFSRLASGPRFAVNRQTHPWEHHRCFLWVDDFFTTGGTLRALASGIPGIHHAWVLATRPERTGAQFGAMTQESRGINSADGASASGSMSALCGPSESMVAVPSPKSIPNSAATCSAARVGP